jgi:hypothetical protein
MDDQALRDAAVPEKLVEQAMSAGVQALRKAEEIRSGHPGEEKSAATARLETNGCILSGIGMPRSELRVAVPGQCRLFALGMAQELTRAKIPNERRYE